MGTEEYGMILDSLQTTGVYVIREDDHRVLYFNKRVKEIAPDVETGMVCHEVWKGSCGNCPLLSIGDKKEERSINYDDPFGKAVEIAATRVLWEKQIPAFVISITPHTEAVNYTYYEILRGNLSTDRCKVIKAREEGGHLSKGHLSSLSGWFEHIVESAYIYEEDAERYQKFVQTERLKAAFAGGARTLSCMYRYKGRKGFRWNMMEIVPDFDYTDDNQSIMIYVKDVHDLLREGLEREENNIRDLEILSSVSEMNVGIYVVDLQTGMTTVVQTTEELRRTVSPGVCSWDKMMIEQGSIYTDPDYLEEFKRRYSVAAMRQAWKNGETKQTYVYRGLVSGEWRYVSVTAYYKFRKRQGGYAIMTFQDVDEQTKKEAQQVQSDRRMAAIVRSRYSVLSTVDLETGHCERSEIGEKQPGRKLEGDYEHYVQTALEKYIFQEDKEKFCETFLLENLRKKAAGVKDFYEEFCQCRYKGTRTYWMEEHIMYIRQGKITTVNILERDITEEKLAQEHAQREARDRAAIISSLSSMFFATYYVNFEKDSFQVITQKTDVGRILGEEGNYTRGIQLYAQKFIDQDDQEEYQEAFSRQRVLASLSKEHPIMAFEYRTAPDAHGRRSWIRASLVLAETSRNGTPGRGLYVAQDVTESKEKEEQEQRALKEACEAANRGNEAKSEFLSRMSHDIRTPMNAIIGMTDIAVRHIDDRERVEDCLKKITVSSNHLLSLINEVLDMSKIESGKIDLMREELNLSDLLDNLAAMTWPSMQAKNQKFNRRITNLIHENVIGDSMRMQQIFTNILGNAVKYTPQEGTIDLEVSEKPTNTPGYGCYEFVFRDNGIGMTREFQKKIFEPFSRAEDSRISKIEGTGLGMTIARNIARTMNGNITVESEPGKGTQFVVTLYLKLSDTAASSLKEKRDLSLLAADGDMASRQTAGEVRAQENAGTVRPVGEILPGKRILLAEDNELNREIAEEVLGQFGVTVESAENGQEAVDKFTASTEGYYDMVIMDIQMPVMNGYEATVAIRRLSRKDAVSVPIIAMTANAFAEDVLQSKRAGMNEHLSKPLNIQELAGCLRRWLGTGR